MKKPFKQCCYETFNTCGYHENDCIIHLAIPYKVFPLSKLALNSIFKRHLYYIDSLVSDAMQLFLIQNFLLVLFSNFLLSSKCYFAAFFPMNSPASKIYTSSPTNPTHPHHSKDRVENGWNDGRTQNAQSRSQPTVSKDKPSTNKKAATYAAGGNKVFVGIFFSKMRNFRSGRICDQLRNMILG